MPTILVIDDTQLDREAVSRLLEFEGFTTVRASNGKEAFATLYQLVPDLILLDLMMPEMDGLAFLRQLRHSTLWHDLPVVVMTGSDDEKMIHRAEELHISDLIPKARFGVSDLIDRLKRHLPAEV